jgi:hypothetical protein
MESARRVSTNHIPPTSFHSSSHSQRTASRAIHYLNDDCMGEVLTFLVTIQVSHWLWLDARSAVTMRDESKVENEVELSTVQCLHSILSCSFFIYAYDCDVSQSTGNIINSFFPTDRVVLLLKLGPCRVLGNLLNRLRLWPAFSLS